MEQKLKKWQHVEFWFPLVIIGFFAFILFIGWFGSTLPEKPSYTKIVIDGCEYIEYWNLGDRYLEHAGNCKNH